MKTIIITRHKELVHVLAERGIIDYTSNVIEHATAEDVRGRHVIGILPLNLAALAEKVTAPEFDVPLEARGREWTLEECRKFTLGVRTYEVREI